MPRSATLPAPAPHAALARSAGLAYLVIILAGVSAEMILRAPLAAVADGSAMARAVLDHLGAFRLSLAADVVMIAADIALALLLFVLLRPAGRDLALAALVLRLMQAAIIAASLVLLSTVPGLAVAGETALVAAFVEAHATGYDIGLIFFGLNSLVMAKLLAASGGVPRWISAGIGLSGLVYLAGSTIRLTAPALSAAFEPAYILPLVAESALCLWLLIRARV